ncbi:MAG: Lipoprotein-releasing system ATP-binding protein LolD [Chlamydiae bacterium]|nr:Lipoprotein-releasing system ATP-binding protein LolD [Chlamydiota bacterium]
MILEAENIHKTFRGPTPFQVLKGVSLQVNRGESVAIMGRSGEGKSTLLSILGTLDEPDQGNLKIGGLPASSSLLNEIRSKNVGFIFQSFHLMQDFTVLENILMPAKIARVPCGKGSEAYNRALSLIERVGLGDHTHQLAKLLSGGEKQRVAIARALCNDPDIIMADEPSGNLDLANAQSIHDLLITLVKEEGKSLILVTHSPELARMCDRVYVLQEGKLLMA